MILKTLLNPQSKITIAAFVIFLSSLMYGFIMVGQDYVIGLNYLENI